MPIFRICSHCGNPFSAWPANVKRGRAKFCSVACRQAAQTLHPEDLWSRLAHLENGCWVWTGHTVPFGYGTLRAEGKLHPTHRLAWELTHGPIPDGLCVLHRCDNPPCCNPSHLFLGTHSDNMKDCVSKNRIAKGESVGRHKLTHEQVVTILTSHKSTKELASYFHVHPNHILRLRARKQWRHVVI